MLEPESDLDVGLIDALEDVLTDKTVSKKEVHSSGVISDLFDRKVLAKIEEAFISKSVISSAAIGDSSRTVEEGLLTNKAAKKRTINSSHINEFDTIISNTLDAEEFKLLLSEFIPDSLVDTITSAIDVNDTGTIYYSDFTNYLISAGDSDIRSGNNFANRLTMHNNQNDQQKNTHSDSIDHIVCVRKPCPMIVTGGRDGKLILFDSDSLELIANISHRDKNSVFLEELQGNMDVEMRSRCIQIAEREGIAPSRNSAVRHVAITSMCALQDSGMIAVGSADSTATIYELGTQDVCGRFNGMTEIPTAMTCCALNSLRIRKTVINLSNLNLIIGDATGKIHIIALHPEFGVSADVGMKKKNQILFAESVKKNYSSMVVHKNWITCIKYINDLNLLLTSCVDGTIAFTDIIRGDAATRIFNGHHSARTGVKTFSYSTFGKYIVSAGDRDLLFWDAYSLEVINRIENLTAPIVAVEVSDHSNKVFAALANKIVYSWHNITYELLQEISDPTIYKPHDCLSAMAFSDELQCLFTAGSQVTSWKLQRTSDITSDDDNEEDLCVAINNPLFNQVIIVKSLGTVQIFQEETGELIRQFNVLPIDMHTNKHVNLIKDPNTGIHLPMIKQACLDEHRTRLIVSSMDLSIQFWNINDGTNILQFQPQLYSTALAHQFAALPKSVCAINYIVYTPDDSRNEKLEVLFGDADAKKAKRFVLLGTETGGICGYQEVYANIDSVPLFFMQQHNISQEKVQETKEAVKKSNFMDLVEYMMHSKSNDYDQDRRMSTGLDSKKGFGDALVVKKDDVSKKKTGLSLRNDLTYNSVLWLHYLENSRQLLVSYSHGQVSFWDFEKHIMMRNLVLHPTGPILVGMRKKGSKGSSETANDTNDATASGTATANAVSMTLSLPTGPRKTGISRRKASISAMSMAHITALNSQRAANHSILPTYTETVHDNDQDKSSSSDSESQVKQDTVWQPSSYQSTILASHGRKYRELTGLISGQNDRKTSMTRGGSDENNNIHGEIRRNRIQSSDILSESDDCSDKIDAIRLPAVPNYNRRDSASIVHQSLATNKASIIVPALTNRKHRPTFVMNLSNRYGKAGIQANSNTTSSTHIPATMLSLSSKSDDNASNSISKSVVNPEAISSPAKTNRNLLTRKDSVAHSDSDSDSDDTDIGTGMGSNGMKDDDSLASESSQLSVEKTTGQAKPLPPVVLESAVILKETNVLIGACSDKYLRFWDLNSNHILCSTLYCHSDTDRKVDKKIRIASGDLSNEILHIIKLSGDEDLLIGGYDTGTIRVWSIQGYSLTTLKNLLEKFLSTQRTSKDHTDFARGGKRSKGVRRTGAGFGVGLAISPILLLYEWTAHYSPILSVDYVWFKIEEETFVEEIPVMEAVQTVTDLNKAEGSNDEEEEDGGSKVNSRRASTISFIVTDSNMHSVLTESGSPRSSVALGSKVTERDGQRRATNILLDSEHDIAAAASAAAAAVAGAMESHKAVTKRISFDTSLIDPSAVASASVDNIPAGANNNAMVSKTSVDSKTTENSTKKSPSKLKSKDSSKSSSDVKNISKTASDSRPIQSNTSALSRRVKNQLMGQAESLEGFLLTASLDQKVVLWTISGDCVGLFGYLGWDINDSKTWLKVETLAYLQSIQSEQQKNVGNYTHNARRGKNKKKDSGVPAIPSRYNTSSSSITKENAKLVPSESTRFLQHIGRSKTAHNAKDLNKYVEILTRKINNRPPTFSAVSKQFNNIVNSHPVAEVQPKKEVQVEKIQAKAHKR